MLPLQHLSLHTDNQLHLHSILIHAVIPSRVFHRVHSSVPIKTRLHNPYKHFKKLSSQARPASCRPHEILATVRPCPIDALIAYPPRLYTQSLTQSPLTQVLLQPHPRTLRPYVRLPSPPSTSLLELTTPTKSRAQSLSQTRPRSSPLRQLRLLRDLPTPALLKRRSRPLYHKTQRASLQVRA